MTDACEKCLGTGLVGAEVAGGEKVCRNCGGTGKAGYAPPAPAATSTEPAPLETTPTPGDSDRATEIRVGFTEPEPAEKPKKGIFSRLLGR